MTEQDARAKTDEIIALLLYIPGFNEWWRTTSSEAARAVLVRRLEKIIMRDEGTA